MLIDLIESLGAALRTLGYVLIGLGLLAMLAPALSGAAVFVLLGLVLLIAGAVLGLFGWQAWSADKGALGFVLGVLTAACGLALLVNPVSSLALVTTLVAIYLLLRGTASVMLGLRLMPEDGWPWVVADGAVSALLGWSIWSGWPLSGVHAVGVLIGVNLVGAGAVLVRIERTMHGLRARAAGLRTRAAARVSH